MNSSAQTPTQNISCSHNAVTESRRFDVEYFFVFLDASTEKLISHRAISDCFATLELALGAQTRLKARYPDCIIQGTKRYFNSENDSDRQELLAIIQTEDPCRYYVDCFVVVVEQSAENKTFQPPITPDFATLEQAHEAKKVAETYYPGCFVRYGTYLFGAEDETGRQDILSRMINDTLDNIRTGLTAHFEAENAEKQA